MSEHKPFVPAEANIRELTPVALILGSVLGVVFAASSVYLGLKVGLTVSASIPVAVLSITLFRWLRLRGTILENNIAQTAGSAGESLAAGVAFTLPSLLLMGFELELVRILLVALLGGLIGVLMMIPLRQSLIVKEHGNLAYPEGTACADVLIVGEKGGTEATKVFTGFGIGLIYAFFNLIAKLWNDTAQFAVDMGGQLKKATVAFEVSPPMLGVGYIIGPKVAANMFAGGLLAFVVLIPLIVMFGGAHVATMSPSEIRHDYVLYIGAGAVAAGGFISLGRSIPTIISAFARGLQSMKGGAAAQAKVPRTERDLPMTVVLGGSLALVLAIFLAPTLNIDLLTAFLVLIFGFFFVTVSSRITGEIGSSSNPISGMTIATLLLTCGLFVLIGRTGVGYKAMALSTAALVCVAASNGGTISQDLKTGFLVGATPRLQQIAIAVGVVTSAIVIGFLMLLLLEARTTYPGVTYPGVTLVAADSQTGKGPDGKTYRISYLRDQLKASDGTEVTRGKYLIDDAGAPVYFVDSAVDSKYPYKLEAASGQLPADLSPDADGKLHQGGAEVGKVGLADIGLDHKPYRTVELSKAVGALRPGRYLVDDTGKVAYFARGMEKFDAPKAQLFALIIDGTLGGKLPWGLVLIGVLIAIILELVGVASLPFAVGLYLPISTSGGIFVGGAVRWLVDRKRRGESSAEAEFSPGMLLASGLIAGGSIAGVVQSVILTAQKDKLFDLSGKLPAFFTSGEGSGNLGAFGTWWPMLPFIGLAAFLYQQGISKKAPRA